MNRHILTDADGVLVFWTKAFEDYMISKGFELKPNTEHEYNLAPRFGIKFSEMDQHIKEFNESRHIATLSPYKDAPVYIKKLSEQGFRFTVVTSLSDAPDAKMYREKNLKEIYGDVFDEFVCLPMGTSKGAVLKRWEDTGYFWIEDHMRQAEAGYEAGLKPILIGHPYNSHFKTDLFPIVEGDNPWEKIYNIIAEHYSL